LCAGVTTYSPLRRWKVAPGQKVGVVGPECLGHVGVKIAAALGAQVVVLTTSPGEVGDARRLGATEVVMSKHATAMAAQANSFDFILDTVSAKHDINQLLQSLRRDGTLMQVGGSRRTAADRGGKPGRQTPRFRRVGYWRTRRDAGNARFLRRERDRVRHRDHPDLLDRSGV
jgi:D-arabinose 1-dehydrogenase-like Zn-dependent alcohol dehydrogenase